MCACLCFPLSLQTGCCALVRPLLRPLLRLRAPHFSAPFAEVDTTALHTGWASIILSYCKVICIHSKLRKSNLLPECHINLEGCGPWPCTAGAKLARLACNLMWLCQEKCIRFFGLKKQETRLCSRLFCGITNYPFGKMTAVIPHVSD